MSRREKYQRIEGPFSYVLKDTIEERAWRALSHGAVRLYVHLKARYIQHVGNAVYLSARQAAEEMGVGKTGVRRLFAELEYYGFIRQVSPHCLGVEGKGKAAHWRLTEVHYLGQPATKDYRNWNGEKYQEQKPPSYYKKKRLFTTAKKTESRTYRPDTVSHPSGQPCPTRPDNQSAKCPDVEDIREASPVSGPQGHTLVAIPYADKPEAPTPTKPRPLTYAELMARVTPPDPPKRAR